jgi:hypothetical protein
MTQKLLSVYLGKPSSVAFCLFLLTAALAIPAAAQDDQTQSVADAARAARAKHDQAANAEARRYLSLSLRMKLQGGAGGSSGNDVEDLDDLHNGEGVPKKPRI